MVEINEDGDLLGVLVGMEDCTGWGSVGEVLGTKLGSAEIIILGFDEGSEKVLSGGSFEGSRDRNLEGVGPGEGYSLGM